MDKKAKRANSKKDKEATKENKKKEKSVEKKSAKPKKEKKEKENKPKRACSAYIFFTKDKREEVKKENPDIENKD